MTKSPTGQMADEDLGRQVRAYYREEALQYLELHSSTIVDDVRAYPTTAFSQMQGEVGSSRELEGPDREEHEISGRDGEELSRVEKVCVFEAGRISVNYELSLNADENYNFQSDDGDDAMTAHATYSIPFGISIHFFGESYNDAEHELDVPGRTENLEVRTSQV